MVNIIQGAFPEREEEPTPAVRLDFSGMDFCDQVIELEDYTFADFTGADLRGTRFGRCRLAGAIFEEADLQGADFVNCSLMGVNFQKAYFDRQTRIHYANCDGANFTGVSYATNKLFYLCKLNLVLPEELRKSVPMNNPVLTSLWENQMREAAESGFVYEVVNGVYRLVSARSVIRPRLTATERLFQC